jgi:replicative DNA helicase
VTDRSGPGDVMRLPPQNIDAERSLVGFLITNPRAVSAARAIGLEREHFYDGRTGEVYEAVLDLRYVEGAPVDQITVGEHLKRFQKLDQVGGVVFLADLTANTQITSQVQVESYVAIILEAAAGRAALADAAELTSRIFDGDGAHQVVADIAHRLTRRITGGVEEGWSSAGELMELLAATYARAKELGDNWAGLDCGIPRLNDLTSGLCEDEFTIIGARPNIGKTTLLLHIATTVAEQGHSVAIFSLEMSKAQCMQRLACIEASVDLRRFRSGKLDIDEAERYRRAHNDLSRLPLYFDHTPGLTVPMLQAKFDRLRDQRGEVPLVMLDYIQLLEGGQPGDNDTRKYTDIAQGIQRFTKAAGGIHTIGASQLSRAPEGRDDHRPRLSDLRESGGLEQAADSVWLIHRPGHYDDMIKKLTKGGMSAEEASRWCEIIAAKTRFGPTGVVYMNWLDSTGEFLVPGEDAYHTMRQESLNL